MLISIRDRIQFFYEGNGGMIDKVISHFSADKGLTREGEKEKHSSRNVSVHRVKMTKFHSKCTLI